MPKIELTKSELREVSHCLNVELENCQEEILRKYPEGCYDTESRKSYQKSVRLLKSVIEKIRDSK